VSKENLSQNYYQILGVNEKCNKRDIRLAYLKLCKQFHPDICQSKCPEVIESNKIQFQDISKAYNCLIKESERTAYDRSLWQKNSRRFANTYESNVYNYRESYRKANHSKDNFNDYYSFRSTPFEYMYRSHRNQYKSYYDMNGSPGLPSVLTLICYYLVLYVVLLVVIIMEEIEKNLRQNKLKYKEKTDKLFTNSSQNTSKDNERICIKNNKPLK